MLVYSQDNSSVNSSVGSQALKENFNAKRITITARKDNNDIGRKPGSSLVPVWGGDMN